MENSNGRTTVLNGLATALVAFVNMTYNSYSSLGSMWKLIITLLLFVIVNFVLGILATNKVWKRDGRPDSVKGGAFKFEGREMLNNFVSYLCIIMLSGFVADSMFSNNTFSIIPFFGAKSLSEWTAIVLVILELRTLLFENLKTLGIDVVGRIKELAKSLWDLYKTIRGDDNTK